MKTPPFLYLLSSLLCGGVVCLVEEEKKPVYLKAHVGESVVFTCDLDFPQDVVVPYVLNWNKEGERVFSVTNGNLWSASAEYSGRLHVAQRGGRAWVNLTAVREPDRGWYECRVMFPNRRPSTRLNGTWFHLTVHGSDLLGVPPVNQTVMIGEKARMECASKDPEARVTWHKDGVPLGELSGGGSSQTRWRKSQEGSLIIPRTDVTDLGQYTCQVTDKQGQSQSASAFLDVHYKARVVFTAKEVFLPHGKPGILDCHFSANPPLTELSWEKDGFLFDPYNVQGVFLRKNGSLFITKVDEGHAGEYKCTPFNELGTMGSSPPIAVVVQHPPEFTLTPHNLYLRKVGDSIQMPCDALDGDESHRPTIVWFKKDGSPLPAERIVISGGNLTINKIRESDRGLYQCVASNEAATISTDTELLVENSVPRAPYNLTANLTHNGVVLSWKPGFGVSSQQYSIWSMGQRQKRDIWVPCQNSIKQKDGKLHVPISVVSCFLTYCDYPQSLKLKMASKRRNMFYQNKKLEATEIVDSVEWRAVRVSGPQASISSLQPGRQYDFMVVSQDQNGDGMFTKPIRVRTKGNPSDNSATSQEELNSQTAGGLRHVGPPRNLKMSADSSGRYTLSWDPPEFGAELLEFYSVVWSEAPLGYSSSVTGPRVQVTTDTSYQVGELEDDSMYHFQVKTTAGSDYLSASDTFVLHVPNSSYLRGQALSLALAAALGFLVALAIVCVYTNRLYVRSHLRNLRSGRH